jgi:hypothetical protein
MRFQGPSGSTPGAPLPAPGNGGADFVPAGSGGLLSPTGILFGPDGNGDGNQDLYVANVHPTNVQGKLGNVRRYDGVTGAFIDTFVTERSGGLDDPSLMTFTATDPVTLAYTVMTTAPSARALLASSASAATAAAQIYGGGKATLTDPGENGLVLDFALAGVLHPDGSLRGAINFIFSRSLSQAWEAGPGADSIRLQDAVTTVTVAEEGTVTRNRAFGGAGPTPGQGVGGGIYNVADGNVCADVFTIIAANLALTSDDDVSGTSSD